MAYESPSYVVVERIGPVEIRDYDGYLAAETDVDGSLEQAGNAGFRTLARFIFGANQVSPGQSTKIAMTSPVTQVPADDRFRVRFMMPTQYTADSLPVPDDPRVEIKPMFGNAHQQYLTPRWLCEALPPIAHHAFGFEGMIPDERPRLNALDPTAGSGCLLVPATPAGRRVLSMQCRPWAA